MSGPWPDEWEEPYEKEMVTLIVQTFYLCRRMTLACYL